MRLPSRSSPLGALLLAGSVQVVCSLPGFLTGATAVQLTGDLRFGAAGLGMAIASFSAMAALASVHLGRLADRVGATAALRIAAVSSTLSTVGIAVLARGWLSLVLWLMFAGAARALAQPAANRLLVNRVPTKRLATAFGFKQSAPPVASMLAGLAVPLLAVTFGWRWAYAAASMLGLLVVFALGRPAAAAPGAVRARPTTRTRLRDPGTILIMSFGFGFGFAANSVILAFYVDASVAGGGTPEAAGFLLAAASIVSIATRVGAGFVCDRFPINPLKLCAGMMVVGAVGLVMLAYSDPTSAAGVISVLIALAGTWGYPGVFWYAVVRAYPDAPGRVTGAMAPAAIGGICWPVVFGALVERSGVYMVGWMTSAALAVASMVTMAVAARRLTFPPPREIVGGVEPPPAS